MNKITAKITSIKNVDNLNIVEFDFYSEALAMMSLELSDDVKPHKDVILTCKASNIGIAKELGGELSYSNALACRLESIHKGELLCMLDLSLREGTRLQSIITKASAQRMGLKIGDKLTALIKASDLSIYKVLESTHERT